MFSNMFHRKYYLPENVWAPAMSFEIIYGDLYRVTTSECLDALQKLFSVKSVYIQANIQSKDLHKCSGLRCILLKSRRNIYPAKLTWIPPELTSTHYTYKLSIFITRMIKVVFMHSFCFFSCQSSIKRVLQNRDHITRAICIHEVMADQKRSPKVQNFKYIPFFYCATVVCQRYKLKFLNQNYQP